MRSIFIRLAVVASQTCQLAQNSEKIRTCSSSGSSKVDDFGTPLLFGAPLPMFPLEFRREFNPLVPKLFHDLPSKYEYVPLKMDHGHEWVKRQETTVMGLLVLKVA